MLKENMIVTHRFTIIKTTNPINICKAMQGKEKVTGDMKTKGNCTFKITKIVFNDNLMCICRSMHILTDFVNSKTNVWSCKK
jgi:hypothetical protein